MKTSKRELALRLVVAAELLLQAGKGFNPQAYRQQQAVALATELKKHAKAKLVKSPVIEKLRSELRASIEDYIKSYPEDANDPVGLLILQETPKANLEQLIIIARYSAWDIDSVGMVLGLDLSENLVHSHGGPPEPELKRVLKQLAKLNGGPFPVELLEGFDT